MRLNDKQEIRICSIKQLCLYLDKELPDKKTIAIFLTMEKTEHPNLRLLDKYLKVSVFDTEVEDRAFSFSYGDGLQVKEFLEKENDFGRLYVCCDSGESRSTAMAAAILKFYGQSDEEIWTNPHYHPNILVYKKQLNAFGIKISNTKLKYLKYVSERALKRAINRR